MVNGTGQFESTVEMFTRTPIFSDKPHYRENCSVTHRNQTLQ